MRLLLMMFLSMLISAGAVSCATMQGIGEDIESAGESIEDAAEEAEDEID